MWKWVADKVARHLTFSVDSMALKDALCLVEQERTKLMDAHEGLLTSNYNLQEEVFGLRDELEAFAKLANVDFIHDLEDGLTTCAVEEPSEVIEDVRTKMSREQRQKRIDTAGRSLAIAIESAHRWEQQLKLSYKNNNQVKK
jgi:hypothetical protein